MISDMRENHFETASGTGETKHQAEDGEEVKKQPGEDMLREDEVEAEFFEFPNQETHEEKEREKEEI